VRETNSNFGFNLPWWDFLFGTYRAQPAAGHENMTIGLAQLRDERVERLHWMLALPFVGDLGEYPINRGSTGGEPPQSVDAETLAPVGPPREEPAHFAMSLAQRDRG
jgi:hypothetical protein